MSALRARIKPLLVTLLHWSGLLWMKAHWRLRRSAAVLMYHRVLPAHQQQDSYSTPAIFVTPETFERHIAFLKKHFRPLTAEQFEQALRSGRFPASSCLVTFDDGWFDNLHFALPILQRHGVPAVVFAATDYIGTGRCFWQETLCRLLVTAWRTGPASHDLLRNLGCEIAPRSDEPAARVAARAYVTALKAQPPQTIEARMAEVREFLTARGVDASDNGVDRFMSWDELKRLGADGLVTIGSHAQSHIPLQMLPASTAATELRESAAALRQHLGAVPALFAYPNGGYDGNTPGLVEAAGYRLAFTTDSGIVMPGDAPMRLRRMNIAEAGTNKPSGLLARLAGVA